MLDGLLSTLQGMICRGKVTNTRVGPRTLLQITGVDGQTQQVVELLLPPGYSARPIAGSDVLLAQVLGQADHVVALGGDNAGSTISDLAPGEFGLTNGTQRIIVRGGFIEIDSPTYVLMTTPQLRVTGSIVQGYGTSNTTDVGTHTHSGVQTGLGSTGAPNANT
jgi:phage gp45-like